MRYELLFQAGEPGGPFDAAAVDAALSAKGAAAADATGTRAWKLAHGELEVRPLREAGRWVATELRIPLSERADLAREAVIEACALAAEAKVAVFDPQLMRRLTAADDGAVADLFLRTARYAGQMLGVSEAVSAAYGAEPSGLKAGTKVLLGILGVVALALLLMDLLIR